MWNNTLTLIWWWCIFLVHPFACRWTWFRRPLPRQWSPLCSQASLSGWIFRGQRGQWRTYYGYSAFCPSWHGFRLQWSSPKTKTNTVVNIVQLFASPCTRYAYHNSELKQTLQRKHHAKSNATIDCLTHAKHINRCLLRADFHAVVQYAVKRAFSRK